MTEHKTLCDALRAVQAQAKTLPKDAINPHFKSKFAPLDTIVENVGPLLAEHGLTWSAFPCFGPDGQPALRYKLTHVSGDQETDTMPLLVTKPDPQGLGSAVTYARRYSLCAVLNLVADDDDDGTAAVRSSRAEPSLSRESLEEVLDAIKAARQSNEWLRGQLANVGLSQVPAGQVMTSTIMQLSPDQAARLVRACAAAADVEAPDPS